MASGRGRCQGVDLGLGGMAVFLMDRAASVWHVRRRGRQCGAARAASASWEEACRIMASEVYVGIQERVRRKLPLPSAGGYGRPLALAGGAGRTAAGRPRARRGQVGDQALSNQANALIRQPSGVRTYWIVLVPPPS